MLEKERVTYQRRVASQTGLEKQERSVAMKERDGQGVRGSLWRQVSLREPVGDTERDAGL